MGASDGARLNFAAQLATAAADLQKAVSARGRANDPALVTAVGHVEEAVRSLSAAVRELAAEIKEPDGDA